MRLLPASAEIAFPFPIAGLPRHLRLAPALGRRPLETRSDPRSDLEIASLAGDGDDSPANVEDEEASPLLVMHRRDEPPVVMASVGVGVLDRPSGERLRLHEGERAAIALLRLEFDLGLGLRDGHPAGAGAPVAFWAHPHQ
jgi:hypothetical protein